MKPKRKTVFIYFLFFLLLTGWGIVSSISKARYKSQTLAISDLEFLQVDYPGKVPEYKKKAIVYVWATWCVVCKTGLPIVNWNHGIAKWFHIPFISIEEGQDRKVLEKYITEKGIYFPVAIGSEEIISILEVRGYPTTIFIDKDGKKIFHDEGLLSPISFLIRILFL